MSEVSVQAAREQAIKAAAFFARVLREEGVEYLAVKVDDVVIVVGVGDAVGRMDEALRLGGVFGHTGGWQGPSHEQIRAVLDPPVAVGEGGTDRLPKVVLTPVDGVLIPRFHAPSERGTGSVHLHALVPLQLGRRTRAVGECLCSKKRGSKERSPDGESNMCAECVRLAGQHGLAWSL